MIDLNSLEKFNDYYKNTSSRNFEQSLKHFFHNDVHKRLTTENPKVLDLGAGSKSLFEETHLNLDLITAIDFSSAAMDLIPEHSGIHYKLLDITTPNALRINEYDLVFDSHCLHCIEDKSHRKMAFNNILGSLKSDGLFAAEMMVQSSRQRITQPFKYIPTANELESELIEAGFKIIYFMIVQDLKFSNENGDCDLLRVISRK